MSDKDGTSPAREAELNDPAYNDEAALKEDEKLLHAEHADALDKRHIETEAHKLERELQREADHLAEEVESQ